MLTTTQRGHATLKALGIDRAVCAAPLYPKKGFQLLILDKLGRITCFTVIFGLLSGLPANAKCSDETYPVLLGQTVNVSRTLSGGGECKDGIIRSADPIYGSQIVTPPKHGTLTNAGRLKLVYRPKPGFAGQDNYSFQWIGRKDGTTPSALTVNVTVTVR